MPDVAVVHLVRAVNGIEPFKRFLDSYRNNVPVARHDLVLAYKGFRDDAQLAPYRDAIAGHPCREIRLRDFGFDIGSYFAAAKRIEHERVCFLNSFSVILAPNWLDDMLRHLAAPGVGVVSASGSFTSLYTFMRGDIDPTFNQLPIHLKFLRAIALHRARRNWPPFPNPHVRTNAFFIDRTLFLSLRRPLMLRKYNAYHFESSRHGLTRQTLARGLSPLVVGRDGVAYAAPNWPDSNTFYQERQQNLMVDDNQTRLYRDATPERRRFLSRMAWGDQARPDPQDPMSTAP